MSKLMNTPNKYQTRRRRTKGYQAETTQILRHVQADDRIYKRRMVASGAISTDGVGRIVSVFNLDPSSTSDWSSTSTMYDEFRVIGVKVSLNPTTQFSVTKLQSTVLVVFDNDDQAAITSYNTALDYQTVRQFPSVWIDSKTISYQWSRPSSGKETSLPWINITTPTLSVGSVKFYADTLSTSSQYLFSTVELAVEFRGIR